MLLVERIERRLEELHQAGSAADILRRAATLAIDERRVLDIGLAIAERFDEDVVPPVVAEVVDVDEALDATLDGRLQADAGGLVYVPVPEVVIGYGLAVDALVDHELEQMGIGPADLRPG